MVALPSPKSLTVQAIYADYERQEAKRTPRGHLGASKIGRECARELWYSFRWCGFPELSGRVLRLLETGNLEEQRIINNLRSIGVTVYENDPDTGRQFRFTIHGGHFGGAMDGALRGLPEAPKSWAVAEFKTANDKSFKHMVQHGVQMSKPEHYAQMNVYMGLASLKRAAYFMVNKNDDALYFEWVHFDRKVFDALVDKARRVLEAKEPLTKISENPDSFACKWCDFQGVCHEQEVPSPNCRTCVHATPLTDGEGARWHCAHHDKELTQHDQLRGCEDHLLIPALIPFAEPVDSGDSWIAYRLKDRDQYFINCAALGFPAIDQPHLSSGEISAVNPRAIGDPAVESARKILDGRIVG